MTESTQEERDKLRAIQSMLRDDEWSRSTLKALNDADRLQRAEELLRDVRSTLDELFLTESTDVEYVKDDKRRIDAFLGERNG